MKTSYMYQCTAFSREEKKATVTVQFCISIELREINRNQVK